MEIWTKMWVGVFFLNTVYNSVYLHDVTNLIVTSILWAVLVTSCHQKLGKDLAKLS